jgi:hypothetical protein
MKSKSRNVALAMVVCGGGIRMGNISRSSRKKKTKEGATERAWCCTSRENKTRRATKEGKCLIRKFIIIFARFSDGAPFKPNLLRTTTIYTYDSPVWIREEKVIYFFLVIKEMHGEFRNTFSGFSFIYLFIYFSYQLIAYSTLQVFLLHICARSREGFSCSPSILEPTSKKRGLAMEVFSVL